MNYIKPVSLRHSVRTGLTDEKRKAINKSMAARRERQGKRVHYLHTSYEDTLPPTAAIKEDIRNFYQAYGQRPTELHVPFRVRTNWVSVYMPELPVGDNGLHTVCLKVVPGEFLELV